MSSFSFSARRAPGCWKWLPSSKLGQLGEEGALPHIPFTFPGWQGSSPSYRQTVPVSADSQPTSSHTNRKAKPASGCPPPPPPTPLTAKGQPSSEGEVPQALGTGSKAGAPDKTPRRERSRLSSGLLLTTLLQIAIGRWEEGASPQDEKAACWVTVLTGHHPYLHKGQPQSLVWE